MELCSNNHEEVCFGGRDCPLCEMRDSLQDSIDGLEKEIIDLREDVAELEKNL